VANWEGLAFCEDYQTKGHGTKGKTNNEFLKRPFHCWDIPTSSKKMAFLVTLNYVNYSKTCIWQSVWLKAF